MDENDFEIPIARFYILLRCWTGEELRVKK